MQNRCPLFQPRYKNINKPCLSCPTLRRGFDFCQNHTPTCKPNSTSVGLSRNWLCFPTEEEGKCRQKEEPSPSFYQKDWSYMSELWWLSWQCLVCVWRVNGNFLEGVWWVSFGYLDGVLKVSGRCLEGVWRVFMGCLNGNLVSLDWWCQDRLSQDMSSLDRASQDWSSQDWLT